MTFFNKNEWKFIGDGTRKVVDSDALTVIINFKLVWKLERTWKVERTYFSLGSSRSSPHGQTSQ